MNVGIDTTEDRVLWDVVEEHLDEAEFLLELWQERLSAPNYGLDELGARVERRLLAHLDGLTVGGRAVAERLLHPLLAEAEVPRQATVAALAVLGEAGEDAAARVIEAMLSTVDAQRRALSRALVLSDNAWLDGALLRRLGWEKDPEPRAALLRVLAGRGVDPGRSLPEDLAVGLPVLARAALRAAGRAARKDVVPLVEAYLRSDDVGLRDRAIEAGLVLGSARAWYACVDRCGSAGTPSRALLLVAMLGSRADHRQVLYPCLEHAPTRAAALWALGFSGSVEAIDRCVPHLRSDDGRTARLAAEAIAATLGLDVYAPALCAAEPEEEPEGLPALEDDDLDADLVPDVVDGLPAPNADAYEERWRSTRGAHRATARLLAGEPFGAPGLAAVLEHAPMRRRRAHALELAIRTGGARQVSTDAFTGRQRVELRRCAGLAGRDLVHDYCGHW